MRGRVDIEVEGKDPRTITKVGLDDPKVNIWTPGVPHARIGMNVGTQHDFGRMKVTAYVEYECDQNESSVNMAGMLAFNKATELMTDGMRVLLDDEQGPGTAG